VRRVVVGGEKEREVEKRDEPQSALRSIVIISLRVCFFLSLFFSAISGKRLSTGKEPEAGL